MTITAKFAGTCPACGRPIAVGSQIEWERGAKARHMTCTSPARASRSRPPATVRPAVRPPKTAAPAQTPTEIATAAGVTLVEPVTRRSYDRRAQGGVSVGETMRRKDGSWWLVVSVARPHYTSRRDVEEAEDHDDFGERVGWTTQYDAVRIDEPAGARAAREQAAQTAAAERSAWDALVARIPGDYRQRHGSLCGGTVTITSTAGTWSDTMTPPALSLGELVWQPLGSYVLACGETGSCAGRVMDRDTLYSAALPDARMVYRMEHWRGFGDDERVTYYLPADVFAAVLDAEIRERGITREAAIAWLAESRGCVDTELYVRAAGDAGAIDQ